MLRKRIIIIISTIIFIILSIFIVNSLNNYSNMHKITASVISSSNNKSEYYGKNVVNYNCPYNTAVNSWKIFYADKNNIYLIAENYISNEFYPELLAEPTNQISQNKFSMNKIIQNYSGSSNITNEKVKNLNSNFFAVNDYDSYTTSFKTIAYLLDTNVWSTYAGENAEFAIGSPTIELLLNSYNQKYGTNYRVMSDEIGYRISNDGGKTWDASILSMINTNDNLYISNTSQRMFVASPSCYSNHYIMCVRSTGSIGFDSYDDSILCFRPVVCLKSTTTLKKVDNNSFIIQ